MPCELMGYCQFFENNMKDLPKSAEYIKKKLCEGDFESCNRYRIFKEDIGEGPPRYLTLSDFEAVATALRCRAERQTTK